MWVSFSGHFQSVTSGSMWLMSWDGPESCGRWSVPVGSLGGRGWRFCIDGSALSFCRLWRYLGGHWKQSFLLLGLKGGLRLTPAVSLGVCLGTLCCTGAVVLGIAACPNQCGRTRVCAAEQEVADIFVCGNTALGCSFYLCHQSRDQPWNEARTLGYLSLAGECLPEKSLTQRDFLKT